KTGRRASIARHEPIADRVSENPVTEPQVRTPGGVRFDAQFVELAVRLGLLGFLIYWAYVLVHPFIPILAWSIVLAVALAPVHSWLAARLGGRRGLAAVAITALTLLVIIGPATWLAISLFDALRSIAERVAGESLTVPPPPVSIKSWPLVGTQ